MIKSIIDMNYNNTIKKLTSKDKFYIDLGLDRMFNILDLLGNPQDNVKCIQVAGTNGKGSVCTMLSSVLAEYGYKTGLYTSPHIFDYTERIKINGNDISETDFTKYFNKIDELSNYYNIHLTEFEILTAIMYKYFYDNNIDIAVIETGLGGRLDATNVIKNNLASIITHIDLDHTDKLGTTKNQIASEKAGIIKPNSSIITSEYYESIIKKAKELNSKIIKPNNEIEEKYLDALPLKGEHQKDNLALVLTCLNSVFPNIDNKTIIVGLKHTKNPCRFQYIKSKNLIVDSAHNPNGFEALKNNLDIYFPDTKRNYIFGCLKTKDYNNMLQYITNDKNLNKLYIYHFNNPNSVDYNTIKQDIDIPCENLTNIKQYDFSQNTLTIICGSFYMLSELITQHQINM